MNKTTIVALAAIPTLLLMANTFTMSRTEQKVDHILTSHQEVSAEFFQTFEKLEQRIAANTTSIQQLNDAVFGMKE